ncbi:MAG: iron-sulfur cluster assembly scaffold protein, partial [Candidatus Competibacteraceae bacterium]|nr:iron-sulfur cluster assembly scaffold protein [Candidatus Competibacteraceae bacterium]
MESSEQVREHFRHPRHAGVFPATESGVITVRVGEPLRGGVIQLQLKIAEQR